MELRVSDASLARRLEATELFVSESCLAALQALRPDSTATAEPIAGGRALFFGVASPLSQALSR